MDKPSSQMTGYEFAKRIVDYYGADKERSAGDVLLDLAGDAWCDWLVHYDSFYAAPDKKENENRFNEIIEDVCALYNTRGGVVLIDVCEDSDPEHILRNRGMQDYAECTCDTMCRHNTLLKSKVEKRRFRRLFEVKVVCHNGRSSIALLVKTANVESHYSIGGDTNHYYVRDAACGESRITEGVLTANSPVIDDWNRANYLEKKDLDGKLLQLNMPVVPLEPFSIVTWLRNVFRRRLSARDFFAFLLRVSRFGFVAMMLLQIIPICIEACRSDNDLVISHVVKAFVVGLIPFVAPFWAAQGAIHVWGQPIVGSYLLFFWPYILFASVCVFRVIDWGVVRREIIVKTGVAVAVIAVMLAAIGLCLEYTFMKNRIISIGGYESDCMSIDAAIGMNELVVRSVEAAELKFAKLCGQEQKRDFYGMVDQIDYGKQIKCLKMLENELRRVENMYSPIDAKHTKLVEVLGGPDQGLIDCLSDLIESVNECIKLRKVANSGGNRSHNESLDRAWQRVSLCNRKFFERANKIGIYNEGDR